MLSLFSLKFDALKGVKCIVNDNCVIFLIIQCVTKTILDLLASTISFLESVYVAYNIASFIKYSNNNSIYIFSKLI